MIPANLSPRRAYSRGAAFQAGFTLVELLVVMAIMGILFYLVFPATASLQTSNNISFAGQSVGDQINNARQLAASRNLVVEARFITPAASPYTGFTVMQLWAPNETGTSVALDRPLTLPTGIEVSGSPTKISGNTLSPLLTTYAAAAQAMPTGPTAGNYVSFYIRPDGNVISTGTTAVPAPPIESYYFTVLPVQSDATTTVPKNYLTVQVNPDTGHVLIFRP